MLLHTAGGSPPAAADGLPDEAAEVLFVGDSVTAGVYFLSLSDSFARQSWAAQVAQALGFPPDSPRIPEPYPVDLLGLSEKGFGFLGSRFPREVDFGLLSSPPLFESGEPRVIMAVPGQTLEELLTQSSERKGHSSSGWIFGSKLLPKGKTTIETAETSSRSPRWVVLFIGANDLLASFGMVGNLSPPGESDFARNYAETVRRLRLLMDPESPPVQLFVLTLPDVTRMPFLEPVPPGARDDEGEALPAGTVTSTFLLSFRTDRFEEEEVWTPEELEGIRERCAAYNRAIREVARSGGHTAVETGSILEDLLEDGDPHRLFSPDLHHPSSFTHTVLADVVLDHMAEVAGVDPETVGVDTTAVHQLRAADTFTLDEKERIDTLMRAGLLGLQDGHFPPSATARGAIEVGGLVGSERFGVAAASLLLGIDALQAPLTTRWFSRLSVTGRVSGVVDRDGKWSLPDDGLDGRLLIVLEPVGRWKWTRLDLGLRLSSEGAAWVARAEWSWFFAETAGDPWIPTRGEVGLRAGWLWGRPGHNGN